MQAPGDPGYRPTPWGTAGDHDKRIRALEAAQAGEPLVPVTVPNIGEQRFVRYAWSSDASCKLPGTGAGTRAPWGTDGTGNVTTNDIPGMPGYDTTQGDTFPIIPGARSSPPGTGLWVGDYFEEYTHAFPDVLVAARNKASNGLYLSWANLHIETPGDTADRRQIVLLDEAGANVSQTESTPAGTTGGLFYGDFGVSAVALNDVYGWVMAAQNVGTASGWAVVVVSVRLAETFLAPFTLADAS